MRSGDFSVGAAAQPYGYVYEIINLVNGKTYVGSRKLALDRHWRQYMGSGKLIKQAIAKYGIENFRKRLIGYAPTPEELVELEGDWIVRQQVLGFAQYNLFASGHAGGDTFSRLNAKTLEEVRRKQSEGVKRHLQTAKVWNSGKTVDTDPRLKAKSDRAIAKGTYKALFTGREVSKETRTKQSAAAMGNRNGDSNKAEHLRVARAIGAMRESPLYKDRNPFEVHDFLLSLIEEFKASDGSLRSFETKSGVSYSKLKKFARSHGATSADGVCFLCIARDRYHHLLKSDEMIVSS